MTTRVQHTKLRATRLAGVVLTGLLTGTSLAACAGLDGTGTISQRVNAWASSTGVRSQIATLQADSTRIAIIQRRHNPGALRAVCEVLGSDVNSAHQDLPTPSPRLTGELDAAYRLDLVAADDCYRGASGSLSGSLIVTSAADRAAAGNDLKKALISLQALSGS
ncbi:MAG: hypothetical protein ACYCTL_09940 [Acidimicrobiales bacterium]